MPPALARRFSLGEWSLITALAVSLGSAAVWLLLNALTFPVRSDLFLAGFCGLPLLIFAAGVALASRAGRLAQRHVRLDLGKESVAPGEEVAIAVTLQVDRPTRIRSLGIRLRGTEHVDLPAGESSVGETRTIVQAERVPLPPLPGGNAHLVQPGSHVYKVAFRVPADAPPSHAGILVSVEYRIEVHVDTVRALDFVLERSVRVASREWLSPGASPEEDREKRTTSPVGLRLEAPDEVPAGGRIRGRVLVENPEGKPIRKITVAFGHLEIARVKGRSDRRFSPLTMRRISAAGTEPVPFELEVPPTLPQPYEGKFATVRFVVQAHADVALAVDAFATRTVRVRGGPPPGK